MPKIILNKFLIQSNKIYRVFSEFLNILDNCNLILVQNLFFFNNIIIIASVFSNKIFLFQKINHEIFLVKSYVENNQLISFFDISKSGSKILIITNKNNMYLLISNLTKTQSNEKFYQNLKFSKKLDFFNTNKFNFIISSVNFNQDETMLIVSYKNKKLRIFDLEKEKFFQINLDKIFESFFFKNSDYKLSKIFGKTTENEFIEFDLLLKKKVFTKLVEKIIYQQNYVIFQYKEYIEYKCYCHKSKTNKIRLPILIEKIITISPYKILIEYKKVYFLINIKTGILLNCNLDFYISEEVAKSQKKISKNFITNNNCINFIWIVLNEEKKCFFIKPLSEKHKSFVYCSNNLFNIGKIYDIKFFGHKNSVILATDSNYISIYETKNFYQKKKLKYENNNFYKLETRGNLLIASNIIGQIIFWKIDSGNILTRVDTIENNLTVFSLSNNFNPNGVLVFGGKNSILSLCKIVHNVKSTFKIEFVYDNKIHNNQIILISIHKNGSVFASVSLNKKIFLWKTIDNNPYLELEKQKRSIWSIDFSTKDPIIVLGTSEGKIFFYNFLNGYCLKELSGHKGYVTNCFFNPNGFHLYTSDSLGEIKIWKVFSGLCILTIKKHKEYVCSLDISQNEDLIVSVSTNGEIIILKEMSSEIFTNKNHNYKKFLQLQKNLSFKTLNNSFFFIFKNITDFRDSTLLFDFLEFFYNRSNHDLETCFSLLIQRIDLFTVKFLFRSIVSWNLERKKLFLSQKVLNIILTNCSHNLLKKIKPEIIDSLLITAYSTKQLFVKYQKFIKNKFS